MRRLTGVTIVGILLMTDGHRGRVGSPGGPGYGLNYSRAMDGEHVPRRWPLLPSFDSRLPENSLLSQENGL